jgi:DNA polymerase-1
VAKKFLLIDGSSLLFRAFFAMGRMTAPDGRESGALYGLLTSLKKAVKDYHPDYLGVIMDRPEPTFRHVKFPEYKGNRPEMPEGLEAQMPFIQPMIEAMGYPYLALPGYEADDLIGTLARQAEEAGVESEILTADKDLLQLVTEKTKVIHTKWDNLLLGPAEVKEKFGVLPHQVVDVLALWGDASDNIPGVTGFGEKTSKELIAKYGSLDELYNHLDELKGKKKESLEKEKDLAMLSRELAQVACHAPVEFSVATFTPKAPNAVKCRELFSSWNFRTLLKDYETVEAREPVGTVAATDASTLFVEAAPAAEEIAATELEASDLSAFLKKQPAALRMNKHEDGVELVVAGASAAHHWNGDEPAAEKILGGAKRLLIADLKTTAHRFPALAAPLFKSGEDVLLMDALLRPDEPGWSLSVLAHSLHLSAPLMPAAEARLLFTAAPLLREKLAAQKIATLYDDLELPLTKVLFEMEAAGVMVDIAALKKLSEDFAGRLIDLEKKAHELAGMPFNLSSPKQVGEVLFEKMQIPASKKTSKTKSYSTDAEVLEKLAGEHEIARVLLDHRELSKLKGTYLDPLPGYVAADGRIHTTFDQTGAATGRLSSRDPNLQNIPVRGDWGGAIRSAFVAPPGKILLSADYSQIELRVMAHLAGDETMLAAFNENRDIHTETAAAVFNVNPAMVTPEMRRGAKAVNFGIIYGQGAFGLARQIGVHPKEAAKFIEAYFARFSGVRQYIDRIRAEALEAGRVTTFMGRHRHFKDLARLPFPRREAGLRAAVNATIQGSAADLMKVAMVHVQRKLHAAKSPFVMTLQVHDELLLEGPPAGANAAADLLRVEMEAAAKLKVPLIAEVHQGRTWAEAKG